MPFRIGLTGNIACGKSTVGKLLVARGADYVDADRLVHGLMEPGTPENGQIVERFGPGVRAEDGRIDRPALGAIVFADPAALTDLEGILHPGVRAEIHRQLAASTAPIFVVDAIKLFEGRLSEGMDANWVVVCPRSEQLRRLMTERGMSAELAETRISAQGSQEEKVRQGTVVIDNSGTLEDMERQVDAALSAIPGQLGEAPSA